MKNHFFNWFIALLLAITFSGCKRDREPAERFTLDNAVNSTNCINCKVYGTSLYGTTSTNNFSSFKTTFEVTKGKMSLINSDSYIRVYYTFNNGGNTSYFDLSYNDLNVVGSQISFDSTWLFNGTTGVSLTIELFTGRGQRSGPLTTTISRPAGAN